METSQIIAQLRDERNMSQANLAKQLHVAPSTVGMWETGKRMPSPELIKQLAGLFSVSADYILGITDKRNHYDLTKKEKADLAALTKRLVDLRESSGFSQSEVARRIGIDNSSLSRIESGSRKVSAEELAKFADLFDVTTDYLLGITDKRHYYDLTKKEEADLAVLAKQLLDGTTTDAEVNFEGEPMTAEAKANLHTAILTALEINKRAAKKKFTPKKYRGSESDKD